MARTRTTPEVFRPGAARDDKGRILAIERALADLSLAVGGDVSRRLARLESFQDATGPKLTDALHKVSEHVDQHYASDTSVVGSTNIPLASDDRIDNDYFAFDSDNPTKVKVKIKGYYVITAKTTCSGSHVTRIKVNGADVKRSVTYSG